MTEQLANLTTAQIAGLLQDKEVSPRPASTRAADTALQARAVTQDTAGP